MFIMLELSNIMYIQPAKLFVGMGFIMYRPTHSMLDRSRFSKQFVDITHFSTQVLSWTFKNPINRRRVLKPDHYDIKNSFSGSLVGTGSRILE